MASLTYREFCECVWFLEWQESEAPPTRLEYYLAQIAAWIEATTTKRSVAINERLIKFTMRTLEENPAARITNSKMYWSMLAHHGAKQLPAKVRHMTKAHRKKRKRSAG